MSTLDIDRYIIEIEDRPAIWDVRCNEYSDKIAKAKAWVEICDIFVPGFREMDSAGKSKATTDIQRKWKSLRDSFRRELATIKKEKSGSAQESGRKEYIYFRQLSFLLPICKTRAHENEATEDPTEGRNTGKEPQPLDPPTHQKKRKKLSDEQVLFQTLAKKANTPDDPDKQFLLSLLPDFKSIPESAKLDIKIEFMNILKRYKNLPTLVNRQFLLSLLPDFKNISESAKLDVKVEIMNILKRYKDLPTLVNQRYFPPSQNFFPGPSSSASHTPHSFAPNTMPSQSTATQNQPIPPPTPSPAPSATSQALSPLSDCSSICDDY